MIEKFTGVAYLKRFECAYDILVSPTLLIPHPDNTNNHPQEQIDLLAEIMAYNGQRNPIVVSNQSGYITKGHARLLAIKKLDWGKCAVDYQDYETEAHELADMQADNRIAELAEQDEDKTQLLIKKLPLDFPLKLLGSLELRRIDVHVEKLEPGCDENDVPELPNVPKSSRGDIYQLGDHRLMCGNSTFIDDVERLIGGVKIEMVYTDPPYGIQIDKQGSVLNAKSHQYGKSLAKSHPYRPVIGDDTVDAIRDFLPLVESVKTKIIWGGNHFPHLLTPSQGWIVWDKENTISFSDAELAYTNSDTRLRIFKHKWQGFMKASERGESRVHPTQKPIALAEWCFENYGDPKTVLDGFLGSGSTLIACEKSNRNCFGLEIDPHYCAVIIERWQKYSNKKAYLINEDGTKTLYDDLKLLIPKGD